MSQWVKSKIKTTKWLLEMKGNRFCYDKGQISQKELCLESLTGILKFLFNRCILVNDKCPGLECQTWAGTLLWTNKACKDVFS